MPRACRVCTDRRREEIDGALASGKSVPAIAREFDLPESNMYRHRKDHLQPASSTAAIEKPAATSTTEFLMARDKELDLILRMAASRGHTGAAVSAINQRIRIALEIANLRGEVQPKPKTVFHVQLDKETAARIANSYMKHEELTGEIIDARKK